MVITTKFSYKNTLTPLDKTKVKYLILHHADSITATPEQIHQWHLEKGWSGAGYNEYIRKDGTVYIMRGDNVGAQCLSMNEISYGICCEGNYDSEQIMPQAQRDALIDRLRYQQTRFNIVDIVPHSRFCATSCPGKYFPLQEVINSSKKLNLDINLETINKYIPITKDYWTINAKLGLNCRGDYVASLIEKFATYLKSKEV